MPLEQTSKTPRKNFRRAGGEDDPGLYENIQKQYPVASFQAEGGDKYFFPVHEIVERGGNRIIPRPRPLRDGDKLDDMGRRSTEWQMTIIFNNSIQEDGLGQNPANKLLYPHILNDLIEAFAVHETGDLIIPTRGLVRIRVTEYNRREVADEQDTVYLVVNFQEDNEDSVDARSLSSPTVSGNAFQLAETAQFSSESDGLSSTSLLDLLILTRQLEGLANAPDAILRDVETQANQVIGAADRTFQAFSRNEVPGRNFFDDPDRITTKRKVHESKELAGKVKYNARRSRPQLLSVVFESNQSLVSISAMMSIDLSDLIAANQQIEDPFWITPGTIVRIPQSDQTARQG